jgi:hypothetical protein
LGIQGCRKLALSCFAGTLGIAIYGNSRGILRFFRILATIWMGSSLTLTSSAGEREIFEHEKHLYLKIPQYVLSKVNVFGVIGILQVLLFSCLLVLMREWNDADSLRQTGEGKLRDKLNNCRRFKPIISLSRNLNT